MHTRIITSSTDLGAAIRMRRKASRQTLQIAALSCGVSVKFLQALETGKPTVQFDKALRVAQHFGLQLALVTNE
jgi:HTH-type transcriptional regulator / antitoxin HipB